jgi:hypothetical protein
MKKLQGTPAYGRIPYAAVQTVESDNLKSQIHTDQGREGSQQSQIIYFLYEALPFRILRWSFISSSMVVELHANCVKIALTKIRIIVFESIEKTFRIHFLGHNVLINLKTNKLERFRQLNTSGNCEYNPKYGGHVPGHIIEKNNTKYKFTQYDMTIDLFIVRCPYFLHPVLNRKIWGIKVTT